MTAPPRPAGHTGIRRNHERRDREGLSCETLMRHAARVLDAAGVYRSPSWVARTVRGYLEVADSTGDTFAAYLVHRIELNAEARRRLLLDPDVVRVIAYADPTGETAVRNVMAGAR